MIHRTTVFALVILMLILAVSFLTIQYYTAENSESVVIQEPPQTEAGSDAFNTYWGNVVNVLGPNQAYARFVEHYGAEDENDWHFSLHSFSSILYETMGPDAIEVCDESFFFACYHEILGSMLRENGLSGVAEMARFCGEKLGCQHGIGHGLAIHFGYRKENLNQAVAECRHVDNPEVIDGCLGGVYMEYSKKTMADEGEKQKIDQLNPIGVDFCNDVQDEVAIRSCHYWIVQWFISESRSSSTKDKILDGITYCDEIQRGFRDSCYGGIGYVVNRFTDTVNDTIAMCSLGEPAMAERDSCLFAAASDYAFFQRQADAVATCATMETGMKSRCQEVITSINLQ